MKRLDQLTQLTAAQLAQDDIIGIRDQSAGQTKYITVKDLTGSPENGWQATGESWTYSSWTAASNIGVVTVPTDATVKYTAGMWVRIVQSTGGTKYGRILSLTSTTLTLWMPGYTLNNEAITSPVYSTVATPVGLPINLRDGTPYAFSAYCSTGKAIVNATLIVDLQTELFDPGNSFASSRYTALVSGYYDIDGQVWNGSAGAGTNEAGQTWLRKNGADVLASDKSNGSGTADKLIRTKINGLIYMAAGDYIELWNTFVGTRDITGGQQYTYLTGMLKARAA